MAFGPVALLLILYQAPIRYVVTRRRIEYYWFGRLREIFDLTDLEDCWGTRPTVLQFADGRRIRFFDIWIGYQPAMSYLNSVLDAGRAAMRGSPVEMPGHAARIDNNWLAVAGLAVKVADAGCLELPRPHVTFPEQCVHCGRQAIEAYSLTVWRGLDLILWSYGRSACLTAPVCGRCGIQRKRIGYLITFLYLAFWLAITWVSLKQLPRYSKQHFGMDFSWIAIGPLLGAIYYWRNHLGARLDRQLLGVGVRQLSEDGTKVTLNFSDPKLAQVVCELSALMQQARAEMAQQTSPDSDQQP